MSKKKIIYVDGNILITSEKFIFKGVNMVCYSTFEDFDNAIVYKGDIEINDDFPHSYFTEIHASGGIASYVLGVSLARKNPEVIHNEFDDNIYINQRLLNETVVLSELQPVFNRLIFIGIISSLETFLCDLFICLLYSDKDYFIKYLEYRTKKIKNKLKRDFNDEYTKCNIRDEAAIEEEIRKYIVYEEYFQSIKSTTKLLYEAVLDINFPDCELISKRIKTRNHLVHRNGRGMNIKNDDLKVLFKEVTTFAESIFKEVINKTTTNTV